MQGSSSGLASGWAAVRLRASARLDQGGTQGAESLVGMDVEGDH
jgi:hypothetical protein